MLASAIRSIFKKLKECGRCKTGLRLSESLFLFLFFYRSSVERYFVIGGFRNPLLLFERLSSSLSIRFVYSPIRFAIRFFHGYLASSEGSAARGSGWNESGSTSRMRFWLQLFSFFLHGNDIRGNLESPISIVILTNFLQDEKRVVGTNNWIIDIRNISIERLLLLYANYLFYEFNSINSLFLCLF